MRKVLAERPVEFRVADLPKLKPTIAPERRVEPPPALLNGHGRVECSCGAVIAACPCGPLRDGRKPMVAVRACADCRDKEGD